MPASTRLETNSLKMVFGARGVFARISCVNWLELVANDLKPSASRAFSVCCGLDFLLHQGCPFGGGVLLDLGQLELVGELLFLGLGELVALRKQIQLRRSAAACSACRWASAWVAASFCCACAELSCNCGLGFRCSSGRRRTVVQSPVFLFALAQLACCWFAGRGRPPVAAAIVRCLLRSSSSASFMTAVRSLPGFATALVATTTFVGGDEFSSAMRLMSVENVSRLNNRKSQMTMRMLRFMTEAGVGAAAGDVVRVGGGAGFSFQQQLPSRRAQVEDFEDDDEDDAE